jgi:hypothetical protein
VSEFQVYNRWRLGKVTEYREYTMRHAGVTTSQAHIKTSRDLRPLEVSNIARIRVMTRRVSEAPPLFNTGLVGLVITTNSDETFLFNLVSDISLVDASYDGVLRRFTEFLAQRGDIVPLSITINTNCRVDIRFDAGYTLAFNPIEECYSPDP